MVSLERCIGEYLRSICKPTAKRSLDAHQVKADRTGFRTPGAHAMFERLFRVIGHELLQFRFRADVLEIGRTRPTEDIGKRRSGI